MKLKRSSIKKIFDINCWRIKIENIQHRRLVNGYIGLLPSHSNKEVNYDFLKIRTELLDHIVNYSRANCMFYRKQFQAVDYQNLSDFYKIPFITKEIIRENLSDLVSESVSYKSLRLAKTGGSSGNPLGFWSSGNTDDLHQKFLFKSYGYKNGDRILAMDGSLIERNLLDQNVFWKETFGGSALPYGGMALSSSYLTEKNKEIYLEFINNYRPDFIRGYPAFVAEIAAYIMNSNKTLEFEMKGVELTSEVVFDNHIHIIEQAFKTKALGQYGHHEACVFGYTIDDSFEYYCSPLYGFTEVLDSGGRQVAPDEEGEIVVTGFSNFGMPFIRYRTGDRAIYGGENNGIVKLKKVSGRIMDFIFDREGEKVLVTSRLLGQSSIYHILRWQIIQNDPGIVTLNISRLPSFEIRHEKEIIENFRSQAGIDCVIEYDREFLKARNGKTKFVVQNIC